MWSLINISLIFIFLSIAVVIVADYDLDIGEIIDVNTLSSAQRDVLTRASKGESEALNTLGLVFQKDSSLGKKDIPRAIR
jgi:hypothetical protein